MAKENGGLLNGRIYKIKDFLLILVILGGILYPIMAWTLLKDFVPRTEFDRLLNRLDRIENKIDRLAIHEQITNFGQFVSL